MKKDNYKKKHLLVISGPMGSGHVRAAGALEKCATERYPGMKITHLNILDFMSRFYKKVYTKYYIGMLNKFPFVWSYVYHKLDAPPSKSMLGRFIIWLRHRTGKRILKEIYKLKPDFIICTHFLPAEILNEIKRLKKLDTPTAVVVTDFSLHWVYVRPCLDYFFVNCNEVAFRLSERGVDKKKIFVTGCPVFPEFSHEYSEERVKKLRDEFNLKPGVYYVLLMMGGDSVGSLDNISEMVLKRFPDVGVIALAGKSSDAYESLIKVKSKYHDRMIAVPFTDRVPDYMAVSMVVVTKPGGISTSECLAMKKPMVVMYPIPGQEERNADYLLERSLVMKAHDEISLVYKDILYRSYMFDHMVKQLEFYSRPHASYDILEVVIEGKDTKRYEG